MTDVARDDAPPLAAVDSGAAQAAGPAAGPAPTVHLVRSEAEAHAAVGVLAAVWPRADGGEPLPPELAWALAHSGNYVAVARLGTEVVGCAAAFRGADEDGLLLHSHILGVRPEQQGARIGFLLKQHQRTWALRAGIGRITWTFDPLVARNAYFNVTKLGAALTRYYVDFYGRMDDGVNDGDETDRCLVTWRLDDARAVRAAQGHAAAASPDQVPPADPVELLGPAPDGGPAPAPGGPLAAVAGAGGAGGGLLIRVPRDIVALRRGDARAAAAWRRAARQAFTAALGAGYEVVAVDRAGTYVLKRPV